MTFKMSIKTLDMEISRQGAIASLDGSSAVFGGPNNCYRYELRRTWDFRKPALVVCMLNPSTADHRDDDPTIQTLIHFARLWGYGGLLVVNLNAFRASSPKVMMAAVDPVGPENQKYIDAAFAYAFQNGGAALAAWGNDGEFGLRDDWFIRRAKRHGVRLDCLGTTNSGAPKHPLARGRHRIPRDQRPIMWRAA
jgi:hypothetical protein